MQWMYQHIFRGRVIERTRWRRIGSGSRDGSTGPVMMMILAALHRGLGGGCWGEEGGERERIKKTHTGRDRMKELYAIPLSIITTTRACSSDKNVYTHTVPYSTSPDKNCLDRWWRLTSCSHDATNFSSHLSTVNFYMGTEIQTRPLDMPSRISSTSRIHLITRPVDVDCN